MPSNRSFMYTISRLCTCILAQPQDSSLMPHNLKTGMQFPDSENAQHNLKIVQILRLQRTPLIHNQVFNPTPHSGYMSTLSKTQALNTGNGRGTVSNSIHAWKGHKALSKGLLQPSTETALCWHPRGETYVPHPVPPFLLFQYYL